MLNKFSQTIHSIIIISFLIITSSAFCQNSDNGETDFQFTILNKICSAVAIKPDFQFQYMNNTGKSAAEASMTDENKRVIILNNAFFSLLNPNQAGDWPLTFVIAHEIGHFQNGHIYSSNWQQFINSIGQRKQMELEADYFAGYVIGLMNATQQEALKFFSIQGINFTDNSWSYPSSSERQSKVTEGWNAAKNLVQSQSNINQPCLNQQATICFKNNTIKEVHVNINQHGSVLNSLVVAAGDTKCAYIKGGVYEYNCKYDRFGGINAAFDYGQILLNACETKEHLIQ